jgi:ubiquinone biosynthesis protein
MSRLPAARSREASLAALALRAALVLGLILRAAAIYVRHALARHGVGRADPAASAARWRRFAARYAAAAMRFRGALIKLGQLASLRVEVLPEAVTDELARLQDRVEPHPWSEIAAQLERELGAPLERRFRRFEREPIAAASLGQVHAATALDGRALAVKVLYPGIERSVAVDLAMARLALWLFDFFVVPDLAALHREIARSLRGEMDYLREGRAAEEIAANLARDPQLAGQVRVPRIHWDLTTRRVLAMEYVAGAKINDPGAARLAGLPREQLVERASRAFLHMIFRDGFFHCDPHPGNLIVEPGGRIAIVDFGMHERLEPALLAAVRANLVAAVTRDADLYARSLVEMGAIDAADAPIAREIGALSFEPGYYNLTPQELASLDFAEYFTRMRAQMRRLRAFRLPRGVALWSRALSLLYALVVELAPGLRPLDLFGPYVLAFLQAPVPARAASNSLAADASKQEVRVR